MALAGLPMIGPDDDLAALIVEALGRADRSLVAGDIVVIASTVVAKAEGRFFNLGDVEPSPSAYELAAVTHKDPRLVEMILRESTAVSRAAKDVLVVRHRLGFVSANAGIDFSNVGQGPETGILLPLDPDASAGAIRDALQSTLGVEPLAVVISDTHGRAFRKGNLNVAIGVAGLPPIIDERGSTDLFGRVLEATIVPLADQVAGAAALVSGEGNEGLPVVIVRGVAYRPSKRPAEYLNWPPESDLFA
jgi:coenzyme F420-0:L-glutamate ligase/coenzyme F420-1:gamma-L-glutamate ligase